MQEIVDGRVDERMDAHTSLQLVSIEVIPFNRFVGKEHCRHKGRVDTLETVARGNAGVQEVR